MAIPYAALAPAEFGYMLTIEVVEPGCESFFATDPHSTIIQQHRFDQHKPWIVCTLYEAKGQPSSEPPQRAAAYSLPMHVPHGA
jgi:hypothetical protein